MNLGQVLNVISLIAFEEVKKNVELIFLEIDGEAGKVFLQLSLAHILFVENVQDLICENILSLAEHGHDIDVNEGSEFDSEVTLISSLRLCNDRFLDVGVILCHHSFIIVFYTFDHET
jgi:hypothetical protein